MHKCACAPAAGRLIYCCGRGICRFWIARTLWPNKP